MISDNLDLKMTLSNLMGYYTSQPKEDYYQILKDGYNFLYIRINYDMVRPYNMIEIIMRGKKLINEPSDFSIIVNSQRVTMISHDSRLFLHNGNETLQTDVPTNGVYRVKMMNCERELDLTVSQIHRNVYKNRMEPFESESATKKVHYNYYSVEKGPISIDLDWKENQSENINSVTSKIETKFMSVSEYQNRD